MDRLPVKNTILVAGGLVVIAYLAGFLPGYMKGQRLEEEVRLARQHSRMAEVRDLAGLAYLQASQKNYGMAAGTCARFFQLVPEVAAAEPAGPVRKGLEDLMGGPDQITAELANGDPAVLNDLQNLFLKTRQATGTQ